MADMHASCVVTIRPTITPERVAVLSKTVIDKLWPGHAGGVQFIFGKRMLKALGEIAYESKTRNQQVTFRVRRDGLNYTFEPLSPERN